MLKIDTMQCITNNYLLDIIQKKMSVSIHLHRKQNPHSLNLALYVKATPQELQEFILTIPYFDTTLKNFLTATGEPQTIISQTWELEFVKKCEMWLGSLEWMYGKHSDPNGSRYNTGRMSLSLPY
jgi:hypothetical protein